jgi:hypothetical protein
MAGLNVGYVRSRLYSCEADEQGGAIRSLHPEKTRIVHITNGFEFLGYKIRKGKGLKLPAHKRCRNARAVASAASAS